MTRHDDNRNLEPAHQYALAARLRHTPEAWLTLVASAAFAFVLKIVVFDRICDDSDLTNAGIAFALGIALSLIGAFVSGKQMKRMLLLLSAAGTFYGFLTLTSFEHTNELCLLREGASSPASFEGIAEWIE
ncbi:MAG: hypothetical protein ABL932_17785 [Terricaulis sp.]